MNRHNIYSTKSPNSQLGYYLAGLIEGDGNIWTPVISKSYTSRIYNPQITFTFNIKDKPFFDKLKTIFNSGSIYKEKLSNTGKYRISEIVTLVEIINLVNGKFRTPKVRDLNRAIDYINKIHNINIKKYSLDTSSIDSNAWLAGFSDADGHFQISLEGKYKSDCFSLDRGRVKCFFQLKQKLVDRNGDSLLPIMSKIANYFQCNIKYESINTITFLAQSNNKHFITKEYFNKYPLISSKYLDYLCFLEGLNYLSKPLTNKEIVEIRKWKNSMNNKRTFFTWYHLNNF